MLRVLAGGQVLHLPAAAIREIVRPGAITRVPNTAASLLGVINLRGVVVPVISLAVLLGLPPGAAGPPCRIVILQQGSVFGVWVDQVLGLADAPGATPVALADLLARDFGSLPRLGAAARPALGGGAAEHAGGGAAAARAELLLVAFAIGGQAFAMRLEDVAHVTSVAHDALAGEAADGVLANLVTIKGTLMRLIDLRQVLGLAGAGRARGRAPVVVTRAGGRAVGLVVDRMQAVLRVRAAWIDAVPPLLNGRVADNRIEAICRIDGGSRLVAILSATSLFGAAAGDEAGDGMPAVPPTVSAVTPVEAAERLVVFRLGTDYFGVPVQAVDEVRRRPPAITPVPHAPDFIDGVMNLRGTVVAVIGQGRRFGAGTPSDGPAANAAKAPDRISAQRIIIVRVDGRQAGFRVDAVSALLSVAAEDVLPVPPLAAGQMHLFDRMACVAQGERTILLINPRTLLNQTARDLLAEFHRAAPGLAAA